MGEIIEGKRNYKERASKPVGDRSITLHGNADKELVLRREGTGGPIFQL